MEAEADQVELFAGTRRDRGAVVDVVAGLEQRLRIDREIQLAIPRALVGAADLRGVGSVDEDRLAHQRRVEMPVGVAIGLADHLGEAMGEATGEEGGDIGLLPSGEIAADDESRLGRVQHVS
jgi:hypothetical protein